jgi:threonine/homoserine/homoserine lactone efflux protein
MSKLLSLLALLGGLWLLYLGYERQQSFAGSADQTLSKVGQKLDGGDHLTDATKFYLAGAVLTVGGIFGLGILRR